MLFACGQSGNNNQANIDSNLVKISDTIVVGHDTAVFEGIVENNTGDDTLAVIRSFIPAGYSLLNATKGDLNLDTFSDIVLALKKNGEDTTSETANHPEKRPLLLLVGQPDSTYKLVAQNDKVVLCVDCGGVMGDPFMDIVIKKGYFSVEHYGGSGWRWTRTVTFKYSPAENNWYLHKDGHRSFHAADPEKTEEKIYTVKDFGKVVFANFDVYKDQ